jgi:iron complex outermembrane receptor protein
MTLDSERVYDVQLQHTLDLGRHRIIWGGGYRQTHDLFINNLNPFVLVPQARWFGLGNLFAQDEIKLTDALRLTGGVKVEQSSLNGTEYMPSVRLAWHVDERAMVWSAVSRAVRTQSRIDKDLVFPGFFGGGPDFKAEKLIAYELGYRARPFARFSFSATAFYHDYGDIRTTSFVTTGPAPFVFLNGLAGKTYGVESWATFDVSERLRLRAGLTVQQARFALRPGANDVVGLQSLGDDPKNQASVRAEWRPREDIDVDLDLREVGALHRYHVAAYSEADLRLAWRPANMVELSLAAQNLLHDRHAETTTQTSSREVGRSVVAGVRWSF